MSPLRGLARVAAAVACLALMWFYVSGATEHGRRVNVSKARGDQSGYLWDAENVYANWHGRQPPMIIGERNRMPVYAGFLALFYHPRLSDDEFFVVARQANIYLSLALLVAFGVIVARQLPLLVAMNLTGIVAFGCFIFKAGYAQSDLLFYFLMFLAFLGSWHLVGPARGGRAAMLAAATGALAGLAHLTKAAMLPFVAVFLTVSGAQFLESIIRHRRARSPGSLSDSLWRLAATFVFTMAFVAVMWPYLSTSKRVFGRYFYNVNSTFYVWYDNWPQASVGTYSHKDGIGWPEMPESDLPGPGRYWREHTLSQIGTRMTNGFKDMVVTSYRTFGYFKYVALFGAMVAVLLATRRTVVRQMVGGRRWQAVFLIAYGTVYLVAIAFYEPISGTGTARFLLAHLMPLLFVLSLAFASAPLRRARWTLAGSPVTLTHFHLAVSLTLALDVIFGVWPRLMTTYGGF